MQRDPLEDLPPESWAQIVAELCELLEVDPSSAEDPIRAAEPLRDATERVGGLVDSWGGGEFCGIFPRVLAYIRAGSPEIGTYASQLGRRRTSGISRACQRGGLGPPFTNRPGPGRRVVCCGGPA